MATQNITLNGIDSFNAFGTFQEWSSERLETVFIGIDPGQDPAENNTLNLTMTGGAWQMRQLGIYNDSAFEFDFTLTDTNNGAFRRIDRLQIDGVDDATVTLFDTRIRFLEAFELVENFTLTLGTQRLNSLQSDAVNNTVNMGSGNLTFARLGNFEQPSVNIVNGGTGSINALEFSENSTNTINNGGWFGSIRSDGTSNNFTFVNGGDSLSLGSGTSTVNLVSGFYGQIISYSGTNTVNVRADAEVRSIGFSGGVDTITVRGQVEQIQVGGGNDRVDVLGNGRVDSLLLGDGNNSFTLNGQWAWAVTAFSGNDTASVNSGQIDQLYLGGGRNTIFVGLDTFVGSLRTNEGDDSLTVDGGDVSQVTLGGGNNFVNIRLGFVQSVTADNGNDNITIRDADVGTVRAGGGNNTITTGSRFIDAVFSNEGNDSITIRSGGAFSVSSGQGNDTINAVGRVDFIDSGEGRDIVTIGALGARFVALGDGNDVISVAPTAGDRGIEVQGDGGIDTVNLSRFTANLTLTLANGNWQEPVTGQGFLAMIDIENAVGGSGNDTITGSDAANVLTGGRGSDVLTGGDGNDTLVGGLGNDVLAGNAGADTFRFVRADGRDTIQGFTAGEDLIELRQANRLGDLTFAQAGDNVRIDFGTLRIIVEDALVADIRDGGNFLF